MKVNTSFIQRFKKEIGYFWLFIFHRYAPQQFNPGYGSENFKVLVKLKRGIGLTTNARGKLKLLTKPNQLFFFNLKNLLSLGALQSRVNKAVYYTFVTLTLELNNPFKAHFLKVFLHKKLDLLKGLLQDLETVNGNKWEKKLVEVHLEVFHRTSLLQFKIVQEMQRALHRQPPKTLIKEIQAALDKGLRPILVTTGYSGSYWMRNPKKEVVGLFKPFDEEIYAPNNPVGPRYQGPLGQRTIRKGCRVGESVHHEVGAFLVDAFFGFGIVPKTYYASFSHSSFFLARENRLKSQRQKKEKFGSFQEFVGGFIPLIELEKKEWASLPLEEFQLLVILDLIIGNTDRNLGNILVGEDKIAAIDHGLCFPDVHEKLSYWYWSYLEQGSQPLFPSLVELIYHFPYDELGWKLRKNCFISSATLRRMKERIKLCQVGLEAGFTPKKLEKLLNPLYLSPLQDYDQELDRRAQEQLILFNETPIDK